MNIKDVSHIEDKDLLERFYNDHDSEWLGILLTRYTMLLLGVCMKYLKNEEEAKDAVQQIFLKVINELPKYKVDFFKSWIYMIAKNYCLMQLRSSSNRPVELKETSDLIKDDESSKELLVNKEETLQMLEKGMNTLNHEQHECITLFYLQKKSYAEIVGLTGFTLLQVKSFIQNGKRNLKQYIISERQADMYKR